MLTPKVLGAFLFLCGSFCYLLSAVFHNKMLLFACCMFYLFGGAAFYQMAANPQTLKGKFILLLDTGCHRKFCEALVEHLSSYDIHIVWVFSSSEMNANDFPHVFKMRCSLKDPTSLQKLSAAVTRVLNDHSNAKLHAIVNMTDFHYQQKFEDTPQEQFVQLMQQNYLLPVQIIQTFLPFIKESKGRIVNLSNSMGRLASGGFSAYAGSKFALEGFTDALRRELTSPYDVKVSLFELSHQNTIFPDWNISPDALTDALTNLAECLASENPKDRYYQSLKKPLFLGVSLDLEKLETILSSFLPATLMDLWLEWRRVKPASSQA